MLLRPLSRAGRVAWMLVVLGLPGASWASDRPSDAFSILEEQEVITAATKRPQPLSETPSAVTVITAAEIRAMGYHSVADALRWVRGMYVTFDRNYSYIGVRGVQRPGDYNDKVLLAIDGHTLNGNVFGDALVGDELGLDLEQVERIEVVRGPGSTLYGSYAVLAVVNVVTRRPRALAPVATSGRIGGPGERRIFGLFSASRPERPEIALSGSFSEATGQDLYFPEFADPSTHDGIADGVDGSAAWSAFGTMRWSEWTLTGKFNERRKTVPTASYGSVFDDHRNDTRDSRNFVELSHQRSVSKAVELSARAYWDGSRYQGHYVYDVGGPSPVINRDLGHGDVVGTEWRANWSAGPGQVVTAGVEAQRHVRAHIENYDEDPYASYFDGDFPGTQGAVYVQDEIRLLPTLRLTGGARWDVYSDFSPVPSPRLDLLWTARPGTVCKLLAGTAFRAPSPYERFYEDGYSQAANPGLDPERAATVEGLVEHHVGNAVASLSAYATRIDDLIDLAPTSDPAVLGYVNRQQVLSSGVEGEVRGVFDAATRFRAAVALQRSQDRTSGEELSNSPRHTGHVLVIHEAKALPLTLGLGARYVSTRRTLSGGSVGAAAVTDARIGVRLGPRGSLSLEGRNLFDAGWSDPGSAEHVQDRIEQDGRFFFLSFEWRPVARP